MKTAYIVVGSESAGNRLMVKLLLSAGCWGDADMFQRLDKEDPPKGVDKIAFFRSYPHGNRGEGRHYPSLNDIRTRFYKLGFKCKIMVLVRNSFCTVRSQLKAGHVEDEVMALDEMAQGYANIFSDIAEWPPDYVIVTYEALIYETHNTLKWLMPHLGLEIGRVDYVYNGNEKWYGESQ